jgi:radical S-adenosyl methionine domain-containing protein 2
MKPISVNFHITKTCNYSCQFCFATFKDQNRTTSLNEAKAIIKLLRDAGTEKINFAGGEPTLYPNFGHLIKYAKELKLTTSIISNGAKIPQLLPKYGEFIDWVGLSVDSSNEITQAQLGRGSGDHVKKSEELFQQLHKFGVKVKLNTVVTSLNYKEDMSKFIAKVKPDRWKVFQVLPIKGQNDGYVEKLLISKDKFQLFLENNSKLEKFKPVVEDNNLMISSYLMIDPTGRFYNNQNGHYIYSSPILEKGVESAINEVEWNSQKFLSRGGEYKWS